MLNFYDIELNDETIDDIIKNTEGKNTVKKIFLTQLFYLLGVLIKF